MWKLRPGQETMQVYRDIDVKVFTLGQGHDTSSHHMKHVLKLKLYKENMKHNVCPYMQYYHGPQA